MIRIDVDDRVVSPWLAKLGQTLDDPHPMLADIGDALASSTRLRFREGKAPDGSGWAPLAASTIARRRGGSSKPLMDTGRLANSISRSTPHGRSVEVGTNVVYGAMQHFGAPRGSFGATKRGVPIPWGDVPGRQFLGVSRDDRSEILAIIREALLETAR